MNVRVNTHRLDGQHFALAYCRLQSTLVYTPAVDNDLTLALVVIVALAFDFTNGFHDTGNAMATSIATGALPPRIAVL